jgi:hypothetical protein
VLACGRRYGKTELGKQAILHQFWAHKRCWWLAPTYQAASQVWRDLKAICAPMPGLRVNETERRMDLPGGGMLAIRSTWYADNLRGAGLDYAVLDEAAFMEAQVWPDVVRPMLLDRAGGALFLSSPKGRNWFWQLYQLGLDPTQTEWRSFQHSSYDNPLLARSEIDAIQRVTWERVFREEYLAEFIDDAGQVFRGIRAAATAPDNAQPEPDRIYVAGVDWGRERDYTVIAVLDAERGVMVALDRFNKVGWDLQRGRLAALCAHWRPAAIWAEANSIGSPMIEALQAEGLPVRPFQMTSQSKAPVIEALALAIERSAITLLPDEVLLGELAAYTVERLPGGTYSFNAPSGMHDDTVIATALAWHGVRQRLSQALDFA